MQLFTVDVGNMERGPMYVCGGCRKDGDRVVNGTTEHGYSYGAPVVVRDRAEGDVSRGYCCGRCDGRFTGLAEEGTARGEELRAQRARARESASPGRRSDLMADVGYFRRRVMRLAANGYRFGRYDTPAHDLRCALNSLMEMGPAPIPG